MIAIKGYKMPRNCIECVMQFGGWCGVSPPEIDERVAPTVPDAVKQGKPKWCPLVEIDAQPVKHGKWLEMHCDLICGVCKWEYSDELPYMYRNGYDSYYEAFAFCPHCGSRLSPPDGAVYEIEDFGNDNQT
jgi:hypothetical protein